LSEEYILEVKNLTKEFPGVRALDKVNFAVKKGEIHALVGENGAGKSTLMKVLSGVYPFGTYEGEIIIEGSIRTFKNVKESELAGIAIIYQELLLVKDLSIAENIFLGSEKGKHGIINWNELNSKALKWIEYIGLNENPATLIRDLGVGKQQLVEIAKALSKNARILILDEPTAALTDKEVEHLMTILRELKSKDVTCIYISHKLEEVLKISDSVTVIRDGKTIGSSKTEGLDEHQIISMMVGREFTNRFPEKKSCRREKIMEVINWNLHDKNNPEKPILKDLSFEVYAGEVLGIAGLMGAGRTELVNSIFGIHEGKVDGEIYLHGKKVTIKKPIEAIRNGIGLLTEDRKRQGLNMVASISKNITMANLNKVSKHGIINDNEEIKFSNKYISGLKIKANTIEMLVSKLSGGNQQKVVLAKWLMANPKILFIDEPTRGIDVGAKYEIYNLINTLLEEGIGIVMVSSELPEILGMSHRVIVMKEGRITGLFENRDLTEEIVMKCATGGVLV